MICPNWACHKDDNFPPYMELAGTIETGVLGAEYIGQAITTEVWVCTTCATEVRLFGEWIGKEDNGVRQDV